MLIVQEVKTRKQKRDFLSFPIRLYKGCPYYGPNLYGDEKRLFDPNYFYYQTCEAVFYNCYRDGKMVGRIGGILQKAANEKWNQKRVRFTRFDLIDDLEVAKALLGAVEDWAKAKGMDEVFGPMGFSDMEKEGLLIEGFEEPTTLGENYNYAYYQTLLEQCGYGKEVDWIAHQVRLGEHTDVAKITRIVEKMMARHHLRYVTELSTNELLNKYGHKFFEIVEETYEPLYQTVPFLPEQIEDMIASFRLVLSKEYICLVVDEHDELVCFGVTFPHITPLLNKTGGHLYPWILPSLLHGLKHPKILEFGLIGVTKAYRNTGISWCPFLPLFPRLQSGEIEFCETNLNLETNQDILNTFSHFNVRDHRRVRAFIKKIA